MSDEEHDVKPSNDKPGEDMSSSEEADKKEADDSKNVASPKKEVKSPKKENKAKEVDKKESPKKEVKESPKKEVKESPKKEVKESPKKEVKKKDDSDEDADAEDLPPGLLEQPLEIEGKREKKKVERLSATMLRSPVEKKKIQIEEGSGVKLGDIAYIEHQLTVTKSMDLKPLHRVLFLRVGTNNEVKKNIRQFCGFTHDADSKEHERRTGILNKMVLAELKNLCQTLGLERSGTKPNLVERIMEFLAKPEDKGMQVKTKRRSKSAGGKKGAKRKRKSKKTGEKKAKGGKEEELSEGDDSEEDEDEKDKDEDEKDKDEEGESEAEDESEDEAPKKKKAKVENKKKTPPKKAAKENGKKEKATPKAAPKAAPKKEVKKSPVKKKTASELNDSLSDDSSDDEPIIKVKKSPPNNDEIKDVVKKILEGADLETVTMKTVVKQVYAKYPSFDLSDRKDFIKDTVREVIS